MSSKAEEITQIRKITAEKYSENKIHTLCVYRKFTGKDFVMSVKMSDLQENLDLQNLCHLASKKIKSYCGTKNPTKDQVKKHKIKMSQWIDDNKNVYICGDLAYNLIRYNNLGVIKVGEFRKNLGISNNQSIQRERDIIAITMKIFAKGSMVRQ